MDEDFGELEIYKWFICTAEPDSVELFKKSAQALGGKIRHVLVKNMGQTGAYEVNWKRLATDDGLAEFLKKHSVIEMTLDPLHKKDADIITISGFSFNAAISESPDTTVDRLAKRRLKIYREKVFSAIRGTGLLTDEIYLLHINLDDATSTSLTGVAPSVDDSSASFPESAAAQASSGKGKKSKPAS